MIIYRYYNNKKLWKILEETIIINNKEDHLEIIEDQIKILKENLVEMEMIQIINVCFLNYIKHIKDLLKEILIRINKENLKDLEQEIKDIEEEMKIKKKV